MRSKRDYDLESKFQAELIKDLRDLFPQCIILKNDSGYLQGIPDLSIFWGQRYAFLEVKPREPKSPNDYEPNQEWYLDTINEMWFASVIYPENKEDVLEALQYALSPPG